MGGGDGNFYQGEEEKTGPDGDEPEHEGKDGGHVDVIVHHTPCHLKHLENKMEHHPESM